MTVKEKGAKNKEVRGLPHGQLIQALCGCKRQKLGNKGFCFIQLTQPFQANILFKRNSDLNHFHMSYLPQV